MLARTTTVVHPSGERLETPLLIPSFSSKGFGTSQNGESEVRQIMKVAEQFLTDAMLVSAYDIHHGYLDYPTSAVTRITYVDSGGYETSDLQDLSATFVHKVDRQEWSEDHLIAALDKWPAFAPAVFVTYDSADQPQSFDAQIARARKMRARYAEQLVAFLIKPETQAQRFIQFRTIQARVEDLGGLPIIGVTEKELGSSFIERMQRVATLRLALDDAKMRDVPIHIFGSLDPISVCLYFVAGAEIFDGLTWIRYGYVDHAATYLHNAAVLRNFLHKKDDFAKVDALQQNINILDGLAIQMRKFLRDGDFRHLDPNDAWLRSAYDQLRTKVGRI